MRKWQKKLYVGEEVQGNVFKVESQLSEISLFRELRQEEWHVCMTDFFGKQ